MNNLQIFDNQKFGTIRTAEENGKVLFCGSDVAKALGYSNPPKALNDHCRGITKRSTPTASGEQEMLFITEGDIYRLTARSQLPSAQEFEGWVFDEVLPSIRKTGAYNRPMSQIELIAAQAQAMVEIERTANAAQLQAESTAKRLDNVLDVFTAPMAQNWRDETNHKINQICLQYGLNYQTYKGDMYAELEETAHCKLSARQSRLKERMKLAGATYKQRQEITKIHVIEQDEKLKAIFDGIVRKYQAKYAVREA